MGMEKVGSNLPMERGSDTVSGKKKGTKHRGAFTEILGHPGTLRRGTR